MEEVGKILPRVVRRHVRGEGPPVLEVLAPLWARVAGKAIAEQARPVAFAAGTLTLATACLCWARELRELQEEIRASVNSALGRPLVKRLRVRHAPEMDSAGAAPPPSSAAALTERPQWAENNAGLDPEIREVLVRSFAKYFARRPEKIN